MIIMFEEKYMRFRDNVLSNCNADYVVVHND